MSEGQGATEAGERVHHAFVCGQDLEILLLCKGHVERVVERPSVGEGERLRSQGGRREQLDIHRKELDEGRFRVFRGRGTAQDMLAQGVAELGDQHVRRDERDPASLLLYQALVSEIRAGLRDEQLDGDGAVEDVPHSAWAVLSKVADDG